jgi:hypothetical protein
MDSKVMVNKQNFRLTLPIRNSTDCRCTILSYIFGGNVLVVQVDPSRHKWRTKETYYLQFEDVLYFEGPVQWKSADFYLGTNNEIVNIANRAGLVLSDDEELQLFIVDIENGQVKVLVDKGIVYKLRTLPPVEELF